MPSIKGLNETEVTPLLKRVCLTHHWYRDDAKRWVHIQSPFRHANGHASSRPFGLCPISPGTSTTRVALLDLDNHDGALPAEAVDAAAQRLAEFLQADGYRANTIVSSGGNGRHLYLLWDSEQDAYSVRQYLRAVLLRAGYTSGAGGLAKSQVEIFPKQDAVSPGTWGSMFALPFAKGTASRWLKQGDTWRVNSQSVAHIEKPPHLAPHVSEHLLTPIADVRYLLSHIENKGEEVLDYDEWFQVICAVHHSTGGSDEGLQAVREWSAQADKHNDGFLCNRVWPYVTSDRHPVITVRTLEHMARRDGWESPVAFDDLTGEDIVDSDDADSVGGVGSTGDASGGSDLLEAYGTFVNTLDAPYYVWNEVLQKGCLYALTAAWGHGKTAMMLTVALHVAAGVPLAGRKVARGKVLYLCGENPADVKLRVAAAGEALGLDTADLEGQIWFTKAPFAIDDKNALRRFLRGVQAQCPEGFDLAIIDTGPAHSEADEENDNRAMHGLAMAMRDFMAPLGMPATVALMHPAKAATRDQLQPRGGGAFSGSIDGELCCWNEVSKSGQHEYLELFHRTKFRGPGFSPIYFKLRQTEVEGMVSNFGEPVRTVVAMVGGGPLPKPQGKWQTLVWEAMQETESEIEDELVDWCVENSEKPAGQDRRKEWLRRAIKSMRDAGLIKK